MAPTEMVKQTGVEESSAPPPVTHYSERMIEALRPYKPGKWLQDELQRADKILAREATILSRYLDIRGKKLLDFGCGAGASSVTWSKLGASVTGVEPDEHLAAAAQIRIEEDGVQDSVQILHLPDTSHLPFADGAFQVCVCNAVLEHIAPHERGIYVREIWRVLEPGGWLYITETPNRLCPYDGHSTRLWGIPWMPLSLARRYGIWRGRIEPDKTEAELVSMGIRGVTYFEIASALRGQRFSVVRSRGVDEVAATADLDRPQNPLRLGIKKAYVAAFRLLDRTLCRWTGVPVAAFLPDLTLCLQKLPAATWEGV